MGITPRLTVATGIQLESRTLSIIMTACANYTGRSDTCIAVLINFPLACQGLKPEMFGVLIMISAMLAFAALSDFVIGVESQIIDDLLIEQVEK